MINTKLLVATESGMYNTSNSIIPGSCLNTKKFKTRTQFPIRYNGKLILGSEAQNFTQALYTVWEQGCVDRSVIHSFVSLVKWNQWPRSACTGFVKSYFSFNY